MTQNDILELIDRIKTEPSVLLLGQNALATYSGRNPFLYQVGQMYQKEDKTPLQYTDLWSLFPSGISSTECRELASIRDTIRPQWWLRKILNQRWNIVYSSGIDGIISHGVGPNAAFTPIPVQATTFKREYISKGQLHVNYLFGHIDAEEADNYPPATLQKTVLRRWNREVSEKLRWIYTDILQTYGVLVIDGWDPDTDTLSIDTLMSNWDDMPYHSVYIFSATDAIIEEAEEINTGGNEIVICEKRSFASTLKSIDFFEDLEEIVEAANQQSSDCKTITIGKGKNSLSLLVPISAVNTLGPQITLLHDELVHPIGVDAEGRKEAIARFLQQTDILRWDLFSDNYGFFVERDIDQELYAAVIKELNKESSYHSKPILLEGASNCGKTASLIHLALKIQKEKIAPVLFIQGLLDQSISKYEDVILGFIKANLFTEKNRKVLVIWDGSQSIDTPDRYKHLSDKLRECNATVVGSCYAKMYSGVTEGRKSRFKTVRVPLNLTPDEYNAFGKMLQSVDESLYQSFKFYAPPSGTRNDPWAQESLFHLLQKLAAFSYDPEWREVTRTLNSRFSKELIENQSNLEQRIQAFQETNTAIETRGIAAAWQIKLELFRAQQEPDKLSTFDKCKGMIQEVNRILAVSGQFERPLPLSLLLRTACKSVFSQESAFVSELIRVNSLISVISDPDGFVIVRFRHPSEAEAFLNQNYPNQDKKKEVEIAVLSELIRNCQWHHDEESRYIIQLVRQFGPNSSGKYSEEVKSGHYAVYIDYWEDIATLLKEHASNSCLEAIVVYAHLLRELHKSNTEYGIPEEINLLNVAETALRQALDRTDIPSSQHCRLYGEYCSNLSATMRETRIPGKPQKAEFETFRGYFRKSFTLRDVSDNNSFSDNSVLDIWLNAVLNLLDSYATKEDALADPFFQDCLADTVDYIDLLFDINQDHTQLFTKIKSVYSLYDNDLLTQLETEITSKNKDTILFLRAHNCWENEVAPKGNLYYLPDDLDFDAEENPSIIRKELVHAAKEVEAVLEPSLAQLLRSRSSRCLAMLLRAKWIILTNGHLPMELKQRPALTETDWGEIHTLCENYILFCNNENSRPRAFAFLLEGIWQWQYGDARKSKDLFRQCEDQIRSRGFILFERIGLCTPGTDSLRLFYVDVGRNESGRLRAVLRVEIDKDESEISGIPNVIGRKGLTISQTVQDYLFNRGVAAPQNKITKPVVVWFNTGGACLGIAP